MEYTTDLPEGMLIVINGKTYVGVADSTEGVYEENKAAAPV